MAIRELATFPQITLSESQGMIGTRRWTLNYDDDLDTFLGYVCTSHFPGWRDSLLVQVQSGALWDEVVTKPDPRRNESGDITSWRAFEDMGLLPKYGEVMVVAQYALHRLSNCWPDHITKPWHPPTTTLELRVRGSGQYIVVTPQGVSVPSALGLCSDTVTAATISAAMATRIIVPVAEYTVSCDRMTLAEVNAAMPDGKWDVYNGCVNFEMECPQQSDPLASVDFLGAPYGTLLMDGYEMQETYVCHPADPHRYRLTACFKKRVVTAPDGTTLNDEDGVPVGWNHDYINRPGGRGWGWWPVKLQSWTDGVMTCVDRYPFIDFGSLFGYCGDQLCGEDQLEEMASPMTDCEACVPWTQPD